MFDKELSAPKRYFEGTHRTRQPQETLDAWMPLMPALGITRLANVTGLDHVGIPVYLSVRPNSRGLSVSQGKGLDRAAAKASALLESIEGWHAENIEHPLRYERPRSLARRAAVVDVEDLPLTHAEPDFARPLAWIEGWDLIHGERCFTPFESVTTDFVVPRHTFPTFLMSSNGLASGNHLLEATTHALTEVIERDALAAWISLTDAERESRRLDLETVDDPHCRELLARFSAAQIRVVAWHVPSRFGLPVFRCTIEDDRPRWRDFAVAPGFGCHLTASVSLSRALTEAAQARLTIISGSRDDLADPTIAKHRIAPPPTGPGPFAFTRALDCATDSFEGDVALIVRALREGGVARAVVVDLTRDDFRIPVVKVVVPGLAFQEGLSLRGRRHAAARRSGGEA